MSSSETGEFKVTHVTQNERALYAIPGRWPSKTIGTHSIFREQWHPAYPISIVSGIWSLNGIQSSIFPIDILLVGSKSFDIKA